jgi:hypothetical protein
MVSIHRILEPCARANVLAGASFTSPRQVRDRIGAFIAAYYREADPFEWTKQTVFSRHPWSSYANLRYWY